jgi:hypothetical protein
MEPASPSAASPPAEEEAAAVARRRLPEELKLRRRTLETVLEQCQRALEMIREVDLEEIEEGANSKEGLQEDGGGEADGNGGGDEGAPPPPPSDADYETDEVRGDLAAHLFTFVV